MSKLYLVLLAALPLTAIAQPTVTDREQYGGNATVHYLYTPTVHAGAPGANQTWNFGSLSGLSGNSHDTLTEHVIVPTGSTGPYAGLVQVERFSDSSIQYLKVSGGNLGISFTADSIAPAVALYYSHPLTDQIYTMTLGATVTDTVTYAITTQGMSGTGFIKKTLTVDAYGTLTLPNGTYNNVVRLKTVGSDSSNFTISQVSRSVSYRWYNANFSSPLLTVDSGFYSYVLSGTTYKDSSTSAQYMLDEHISTGISAPKTAPVSFRGHIMSSNVVLAGGFNASSNYNVYIFNMSGQKVYTNNFSGGSSVTSLPISDMAPGAYTIMVMEAGNISSMSSIKTIKE